MSVPCDFLPCPISSAKYAYAISSHNWHWNVSLPSGASPWNGKFVRVEGQNTTPGTDGNEEVLCIPQNSSITGTLDCSSDCLVSYLGHSLVESYPSADIWSVYSTAPADWEMLIW